MDILAYAKAQLYYCPAANANRTPVANGELIINRFFFFFQTDHKHLKGHYNTEQVSTDKALLQNRSFVNFAVIQIHHSDENSEIPALESQ